MIRLRAPAKLNLYLRVVGKRPDGYHELETVFERIDLADELTFEPEPHGLRLTCDDPALPCDETNLVLQAARLLQRASGVRRSAHFHLTKRIPIAAGLGGGSSDAAATLRGLNTLWQLGWDRARLMELAAQVGSDAPFFLLDSPWAIGRGRGEVLEPVPAAASLLHVVVVPEERLSTREVFESLDSPRRVASQREAGGARSGRMPSGVEAEAAWRSIASWTTLTLPVRDQSKLRSTSFQEKVRQASS